jgi:anhydro-N-acetylmuramic acid kinase
MELVIPENKLFHGKEAFIFALLGVLRWENNYNALRSVTGAASSSTGGAIYCY